ncbi:MAG: cysteine--tRNA ligase [Patescibacteria group bacterium]
MAWFPVFWRRPDSHTVSSAPILLSNTLTGKKEIFTPHKAGVATLYSCGPTVYSKAQIGNLRAYVFADTLSRMLSQAGYRVRRVINITDVGHLVSDADEGEDKMLVGSAREGLSAEDIALKYTNLFMTDLALLGIDVSDIRFPKATEYIPEQIALTKELENKGHTYRTSDGIYFDTSSFPGYDVFGTHGKHSTKEAAVADIGRRITLNKEKRSPADFALWRFSTPSSARLQEWDSPWGRGFPGWHVECSAMARALLGQPIDIHTGGVDHIPVHHTNEIAQSQAAYGTPLARYWMHQAFLTIDGTKVSKSLGNDVYLADIADRGYHPLALRYFFLQAHYSSSVSFTWDALAASDEALKRLWRLSRDARALSSEKRQANEVSRRIMALVRDDLATPQALALLWETVKDDEIPPAQLWDSICVAEEVFGLRLTNPPAVQAPAPLPEDIQALVIERDAAREVRDFTRSDELRIHIQNRGYLVEDSPSGTVVTKGRG